MSIGSGRAEGEVLGKATRRDETAALKCHGVARKRMGAWDTR